MTTSEKLQEVARTFCWKHQGLHANHGQIHKDFFAKGPTLIVVTYDVRDRILTARRSLQTGVSPNHLDRLGPSTPDKIKHVVHWMKVHDK